MLLLVVLFWFVFHHYPKLFKSENVLNYTLDFIGPKAIDS